METELTTTRKNDELQLCYNFKRDSEKILSELQRKINWVTEIPKSQIKAKRDLRNVLCGACRGKSYEILNLPLSSFSNVECQTVDRFSELQLSNSNEEFLNQMVHILIENERLGCTKSRNEGYDDQNRRTRQNTSVQTLRSKGVGVNKGTQNDQEEQDTDQIRMETTLSEQIKRLTLENQEFQNNLQSKQELIKKLQIALEEQSSSQKETETALSVQITNLKSEKEELQSNLNIQISKLTSENEKLESNLQTQRTTVEKLQTTLEMKAQETDVTEKGRDTYHPLQRRVQCDSSPTSVDASSDRDVAPEKPLDTDTCSIGQAKQDNETPTMKRKEESEQIEITEMEFEKLTQDIESSDHRLSTLQSQDSTHSTKMNSFTLHSSSTQETLLALRSENDRLFSDRKKLQEENIKNKDDSKENREKLIEANSELDRTRTENARLKEDRSKIVERLQTSQDENHVYESEIMEFKQENIELKQSLKEKNEKLTHSIDELEQIKKADCNTRDDEPRSMETEKVRSETNLERLKEEKQKLQRDVDDLNTKIRYTESELKKIRNSEGENMTHLVSELRKTSSENEVLADSLKARDDELKSLKTEKGELDSNMERLKQGKQNLQHKLDDLNSQMAKMESELKKTKTENEKLEDSKRARDDDLNSLKTEKSKLDSHMERVKQEKQNLQHKLDDLKSQMTIMESELKKTKTDNKNLADGQRARDDELKSSRTEKSKLDSHMERAKQEKQNLQHKLDGLDAQMAIMESELKKTRTDNKNLADGQNEHREEKEKLRHQIKELSLPKRKRVVLGLRSEKSGLGKSLVDMVTKGLTSRLQQRLDMFNLNLTISFSQTPSEVTNGLQIILCLNMSRVGTNILDTLKGTKADRDMFVMVLHHTSKENLSSLTPTSLRVTGSELRQLGGILDMAFDSSSGLYDCDLNNTAVDKIASILRKCLIL